MNELIVVKPLCREKKKAKRLTEIVEYSTLEFKYEVIGTVEEFEAADLRNKRILFAISLGESGINLELYSMLKKIRLRKDIFEGSVAVIIVDGDSELYTKSIARDLVYSANSSGCTFIGKPLVEGTRSLENFTIIAKNMGTDNYSAYINSGKKLVERLMNFEFKKKDSPNILALHSSNSKTSNTLILWSKVKEHLTNCEINEVSLQNGEIFDCIGCPYSTCLHYGEKGKCVYGGVIVDQVYPGILNCDALVMICPNYNDALGANLSAFVNRLTALFRNNDFSKKKLFSIIVSGYSGGDIVAQQLISGMNMNKAFILPSNFTLIETANNPKSILDIKDIDEQAKRFAENIMKGFY
ncbi:MAG: NAD(P)H-dependent oxidoreductase [Peptostreptococcaceae bacterium]|nr:NAD(P)H-dependent oxidoreductase [Peptostreptococcaceae bacterium]